jgi:hypothetical protein
MSETLTLEAIKADHAALAARIAKLEAQAKEPDAIHFPEALIPLRAGEHCAGIILGKEGRPSYYLILLPGEAENITWQKAVEWSDKQGGEYLASLPDRREQALLYANLKEHFKPAWYWSCEQHASNASIAWDQDFGSGGQGYGSKSYEGRARAVRRLFIE